MEEIWGVNTVQEKGVMECERKQNCCVGELNAVWDTATNNVVNNKDAIPTVNIVLLTHEGEQHISIRGCVCLE